MNSYFRCWTLTLVTAVTLLAPRIAAAQAGAAGKPVAVVSIGPVDSLLADITYVTATAGTPDVGKMVAQMIEPVAQGLDRAKPAGVIVTADDQGFYPLGFVPVKDLAAMLKQLEPQIGPAKDAGGGVFEIAGPVPIFVKHQTGYAYIGQTVESLGQLPQDPLPLLGGLNNEYDIAVRGNVRNVPEPYRQMALQQLKQGVELGMQRLPDEDEDQYQMRRNLVQSQVAQMNALVNETDQVTLGWSIDADAKKIFLDTSLTAVPGTKTAERIAMMADVKSEFTGFLIDSAAMTMNFAGKIPQEEIDQTVAMLQTVRANAIKEIENDDDLPNDEARATATELIGSLFDLITETLKSGKMDGGAAVLLAPKAPLFMAGGYVADGSQLETALKKVVELAKQEQEIPDVKFDADQHAGVRFHTMSMPLPEAGDVGDAFGENLDVAVGIGEKSAYFAVGQDGVARLKEVIDQSAAAAGNSVPPFQISLSLEPIMAFAQSIDDNPIVSTIADALKQAQGKDHILIHAKTIPNGVTYRLEVEEGVVKAVGQAIQLFGGGAVGGGF